jgi:hypothetical protein
MRKAITYATMGAVLACNVAAKHAKWTYYWITLESEESGSGSKNTSLKTCNGKTIAKVTKHYAERVRMEGTGKLNDGRVINLGDCDCDDGFSCFEAYDPRKYPWGIGSHDNPILPYTHVAANDHKVGTRLYIPKLDGKRLPGANQAHNGCVEVGDKGWSFGSKHLDFFVGKQSYYNKLDKVLGFNSVDYEVSDCQPKVYGVTIPSSV